MSAGGTHPFNHFRYVWVTVLTWLQVLQVVAAIPLSQGTKKSAKASRAHKGPAHTMRGFRLPWAQRNVPDEASRRGGEFCRAAPVVAAGRPSIGFWVISPASGLFPLA